MVWLLCLLFISGIIFNIGIVIAVFAYGRIETFVPKVPAIYANFFLMGLILLIYGLLNDGFGRVTRLFPFYLVLFAGILRLIWVFCSYTVPISDFKVMYDYAVKAAAGDYSFTRLDYFLHFPYQLGYTLYQSVIIRLFGETLLPLKLCNVVFETFIVWLVYRLTTLLFGKLSGRVAGLMYATYIPNITMTSVLTNQHLSILFFTLGCYLIVKGQGKPDKTKYILFGTIGSAVSFAIGTQFRPMGLFYSGVCLLFIFLREWGKGGRRILRFKKICTQAFLFGAFYFLMIQLITFSLVQSGIMDKEKPPGDPYWKFVVGLNSNSKGAWNEEDSQHLMKFPLGAQRNAESKKLILQRLQEPRQMLNLLIDKWMILWVEKDTSLIWNTNPLSKLPDSQYVWLPRIERAQYLLFCVLTSFVCLRFLKQVQKNRGKQLYVLVYFIFPLLVMIAYVLVHSLIEVQDRYRLDIMPFFIALAGYGGTIFYHLFKRDKQEAP